MSGPTLLLDEHVDRVFEHLLADRGFAVEQAKDALGEATSDRDLLVWCRERDVVLLTNNAKDFERLDDRMEHPGVLCYRDQHLPKTDPEGFDRAVEEVFAQYGTDGVSNHLVELDEWYDWLHE